MDHFHCTNDSCAYVTLSVIDAEQHAAKCEHHAKTSASKMETSLLASESAAEDYPEAKKQRMTCPECNDESGSISGSGYLSETSSTRKVSSAVDWDKLRYSSEGEEEDDYLNSCATNGVSGGSIAIVSQEELSKQSAVVMKQKQEDKTVADDSLFVCVKVSLFILQVNQIFLRNLQHMRDVHFTFVEGLLEKSGLNSETIHHDLGAN